MIKKKILFIFGTRPEAIKLAPIIKEFEKNDDIYQIKTCVTAQHREMLDQVISFFNLKIDFDLNLMKKNQTLFEITSLILNNLEKVLNSFQPDLVFVQGDTTTAFVGALAAFYKKIKIAHIEAGLRSFDIFSPYPEEANRKFISSIASFHFVPTDISFNNLINEQIKNNIFKVGNSVIDALLLGIDIIKENKEENYFNYFNFLNLKKKIVLITAHRRENFGKPFEKILKAIKELAKTHKNTQFVYPVHLNPNIKEIANKSLKNIENIFLINPLDYPYLIFLMSKSYFILTDSGGIQEEAPSLNKPVLVLREKTERVEAITNFNSILVGSSIEKIVNESNRLFNDKNHYEKMSKRDNPYGDGNTSKLILDIIKDKI
jgi:UDP-N-acetylglucosamine 2-epimerase (non-hydrolysing)